MIDNMSGAGCNFRTYQAVAELTTGLNLTSTEINSAVIMLQNTPNAADTSEMALSLDMTVNNPDQVMNDAFSRLGATGITATAGWGGNGLPADFTNISGKTSLNSTHHQLGDSSGNLLFDPYTPDIPLTNTSTIDIFLHR